METLLLMFAYTTGDAPFCLVDNFGNMTCFYYTLDACERAADHHIGSSECVVNPDRED